MHTFVVVASKPGRTIPRHALEILRLEDLPELVFEPKAHVSWLSNSRDVAFGGWQAAPTVFGTGDHWNIRRSSLTAFAGYIWPTAGGWTTEGSWAAQLANWCDRRHLAGSIDCLTGIYAAVSVSAEGSGWVVSDPLGMCVLYVGETPEISVISNRASLTARLIAGPNRVPERDPIAAGWLAYFGSIVGDRTGFKGVRTVPQGSYAEIDRDRGLRLRSYSDAPWRATEPSKLADAPELIGFVRDDLVRAVRTAVTLPARRPSVDLTGGKDTRLILAILLSEGLCDQVTFRTVGPSSSRDAVLAQEIARQFGLDHEHGFSEGAVRARASGLEFEDRLRTHVSLTSGMLDAWDLQNAPFGPPIDVRIGGLCGETLRTQYPGLPIMQSTDELIRRFREEMDFDALGLVRQDVRRFYDRETQRSLLSDSSRAASPNDLLDAFPIRNPLRRKYGTSQEILDAYRVTPLYSLVGLHAAFALGAPSRRNELIHFTIMKDCSEQLTKIPFAKGGWREEVTRRLADTADYRAAFSEARRKGRKQRFQTPRQEFNAQNLGKNQQVFEKYLTADREHPIFEVIDRQAATAVLKKLREGGQLSRGARVQLFGALTAAIWLGQSEAPLRTSSG
jgi:hypothetical protein